MTLIWWWLDEADGAGDANPPAWSRFTYRHALHAAATAAALPRCPAWMQRLVTKAEGLKGNERRSLELRQTICHSLSRCTRAFLRLPAPLRLHPAWRINRWQKWSVERRLDKEEIKVICRNIRMGLNYVEMYVFLLMSYICCLTSKSIRSWISLELLSMERLLQRCRQALVHGEKLILCKSI